MSSVAVFLTPLVIILGMVLFALTLPFWRKDPSPISFGADDNREQEYADLQVERGVLAQSLQELEMERAQGRMEPNDYERLKATDEHRLLQLLDRLEFLKDGAKDDAHKTQDDAPQRKGWVPAIASGLIVLLASVGIYVLLQMQAAQKLMAVEAEMGGGPNPMEMVAKLEARLKENPDDLQGQIMAGRSYQALGRLAEAQNAWAKVLELDPKQHEARYNYGVLLIDSRKIDDPKLFQEALNHFDIVLADLPNQPAVNWYRGIALWYLDRKQETDAAWSLAAQNMEPGSQDLAFVKESLTKLRAGQAPF
ncbi:MAG: tetratricopeptide repeat protein [Nitrospirota bacterium]|nr:tetratricopeptide repeat protein [Nitrospirota bacterium]